MITYEHAYKHVDIASDKMLKVNVDRILLVLNMFYKSSYQRYALVNKLKRKNEVKDSNKIRCDLQKFGLTRASTWY